MDPRDSRLALAQEFLRRTHSSELDKEASVILILLEIRLWLARISPAFWDLASAVEFQAISLAPIATSSEEACLDLVAKYLRVVISVDLATSTPSEETCRISDPWAEMTCILTCPTI